MVTRKTIKTVFKLRRDTAENWDNTNPILQLGEPGFAYDVNVLKIGDGEKHWKDLPQISADPGSFADIAFTGNIDDLVQDEDSYIVFDCGTASSIIS